MIKKSKNGLFWGVCAGIGKSLGINEFICEIIGLFLFFETNWFWFVYIMLAIFMDQED